MKKNRITSETTFLMIIASMAFIVLLLLFIISFLVFYFINTDKLISNELTIELKDRSYLFLTSYSATTKEYYFSEYGWALISFFIVTSIFIIYAFYAVSASNVVFGKTRIYLYSSLLISYLLNLIMFIWLVLLTPFKYSSNFINSFLLPSNHNIGIFDNKGINTSNLLTSKYGLFTQINNNEFRLGSLYFLILGFAIASLIVISLLIISWIVIIVLQKLELKMDYLFEKRKRNNLKKQIIK